MSITTDHAPELGTADGGAKQWRDFLTSAERDDLAKIEAEAGEIDKRRQALSAAIRLIRDRCVQRRRYEAMMAARDAA